MLQTVDLIVLVAYLVGVVGFGCWFARSSGTAEEFTAAGRSLPGWAVGLSIFGTYVSSISFLANPGKSFGGNWNAFTFSLSLPLAAWVATRWFVPFYRGTGEVSAYQHLERRFGRWARTYAVVCYLLTQLARVGTILYLVALALVPLTGWDVRLIIVVTGVLVTLYTLLGGIEAVIWTDVVQSIVLTVGMFVSAAILLAGMPGGAGAFLERAASDGSFSLGSLGPSLREPTFWVVLMYGLFVNLQNFGIDQSYVQRYATAKTDGDAKRSVWLGALLYLPISAVLFFIGTALFAFYAGRLEMLPHEDGVVKGDAVFPYFIAHELPVGATGILVAAICAAAMSSVDSSLNGAATLTLYDLAPYVWGNRIPASTAARPVVPAVCAACGSPLESSSAKCDVCGAPVPDGLSASPPETQETARDARLAMRILYGATLFWGVLGTSAALAMIRVKSALDVWWNLAGMFSGGMLGLFLLGMLSRRAGNAAAAIGVAAGVLFIGWASLAGLTAYKHRWFGNPLDQNLTIVFGTSAILLIGFLVASLLPSGEQDDAN